MIDVFVGPAFVDRDAEEFVVGSQGVGQILSRGQQAVAFTTAPKHAAYMVFMPTVQHQESPEDVVWFDRMGIYRLEELLPAETPLVVRCQPREISRPAPASP